MRDRFLAGLAANVVSRPRIVLVGALLATLGAAALLPGLRVEASHASVFDADDPHQRRFADFLQRFGSPNLLFVIVGGGTPASRHAVIDRLSATLPAAPGAASTPAVCSADGGANAAGCVRDVVGRVDVERLKRRALLYLPLDRLRLLVEALADDQLGVARLLKLHDLPALVGAVAAEFERRLAQAAPVGPEAARPMQLGLEALARFFAEAERRLGDEARAAVPLEQVLLAGAADAAARAGIDAQGYFTSRDGKLALAIIRPLDDRQEPEVLVPFVEYVRQRARALTAAVGRQPGASAGAAPLELWVTGLPALQADERALLQRDMPLTTAVAVTGILLLFIFAFRSIRQGLLGVVPLLCALVWTLAFARLALGGLNMVTSAFIPTMLGLGIDFSVHLLARYNEARWRGRQVTDAIGAAIVGAGPGILTGALTTAGAFFALAVNEFKGFAQLGIITAVGLLFSLLATVIGATMMVGDGPVARFLQRPPRPRADRAGGGFGGWVVRHRAGVLVGGVLLTALMLWQVPRIRWSYNYLDLLPAGSASVEGMHTLSSRTDFSGEVAVLEAGSIAQTRALVAKLERQPAVGRVESVASYLPKQQREKLALLARLAAPLATPTGAGDARGATAIDLAALDDALQALGDALEDARFEAKRAGHAAAAQLVAPARAVASLRRALARADRQTATRRLGRFERQVFDGIDHGIALLRSNVEASALTADQLLALLPPGIAGRLSAHGRYAIYAHPARSVWQDDNLPRFVAAVRAVQPDATGFTVTHWEANVIIRRGFRQASILAVIVLVVLLLLDFRRPVSALLALLPLAMGVGWMLGAMALLGMSYNFANIIAFPLIVGIGVASGVHILHRFRQEGGRDVAPVVRHTGMAILLSAATTMVGFGSLSLASHRGAAELGLLLLLGVGACLVLAVAFLPALLSLLNRQAR